MFTDHQMKELAGVTTKSTALTVYLNTDPALGSAETIKLRLRTLLKDVDLEQDVNAVLDYFGANHPFTGKGIAVFSCKGDGVFRSISLGVPVRDQVFTGNHFSIKPLADVFDIYGSYGVILVDRQGARAFYFHLGELVEQEGVLGTLVKHTKQGGASTIAGQRGGTAGQTHYEDEVVDRNMKEIAAFAVKFFEDKHIRRILIGGTDDNVALFKSQLPKTWQSLIIGTFPMSMTATHAEVYDRAMQIGKEAEAARDLKMVQSVISQAGKGAGAEIGLENTLQAVSQSRVQTLVVTEGFRQSAHRCTGCGRLTLHTNPKCKDCGSPIVAVEDGVELAVNAVMRSGGDVEIVPVTPDFSKAGNIGAFLRY
jgi:peptide subunit release factor 1 (eRF1)